MDANEDLKMNTTQKNQFTKKKKSFIKFLLDYLKKIPPTNLGEEENGVGKFNDFTPKPCRKLRIWVYIYRSSAPCFNTIILQLEFLMMIPLLKGRVLLTPERLLQCKS
jgi:hypothetical protein